MRQKIIALVDCDCFFVSCERVDRPDLNGRPVCVVTSDNNKGIVVSRSAEAKALGIKMGAPMFQIKDRYDGVHYIPVRHSRYGELSKQVMDVLRTFAPVVEEVSVDEAYMDLTGLSRVYKMTYRDLIVQIRQKVMDETGIPVSVGLGTSKTLAKLASDKAKTNGGIFIIPPDRIREMLANTALEEVCGIGHQAAAQYGRKGIVSVVELLDKEVPWVRQAFGVNGERLRYELAGVAVAAVNALEEAPQSIQDTRALEDFTGSLELLQNTMAYHVHRASQKLRRWNGYCQTLAVMVRTKDFRMWEEEVRLEVATNSEARLLKQARELLARMYKPKVLYRATGVTLKNLVYGEAVQESLFGEKVREDDKVSHLIDELEARFGRDIIRYGG